MPPAAPADTTLDGTVTDYDPGEQAAREGKPRSSGHTNKRRKREAAEASKSPQAKSNKPNAQSGGHVRDAAPQSEAESTVLTAYQQRAQELRDELTRAPADSDADKLHALGVLAVKLDELLVDMRSIGVPDSSCAELAELLAQLRCLLAEAAPVTAAIAAQLQAALDVLERFALQAVAVGGA